MLFCISKDGFFNYLKIYKVVVKLCRQRCARCLIVAGIDRQTETLRQSGSSGRMWRFQEPGPNLFSSTNGILSASFPVANEDGLFVSGTLGLLSPLAAGESMDGYPASPASLGAG